MHDTRRMQELRPLAPVDCEVVIFKCDKYVWPGPMITQ